MPGAFREAVAGDADAEAVAAGILRHAAFLVDLRARTGRTITLALEPEPACYLETIDDVVPFFEHRLFDRDAVSRAAAETGIDISVDDVRMHVGICLDACHMAVEFEHPAEILRRLSAAGIRISKVQLSSALRVVSRPRTDVGAMLRPFADDTYLHQVVQRDSTGRLLRYTDLPDALAAAAVDVSHADREWRVHFHVPIFLSSMNGFDTTQPDLVTLLQLLRAGDVCTSLEVETYTWDVLPPEYRNQDVSTAIARELNWVRTTLGA